MIILTLSTNDWITITIGALPVIGGIFYLIYKTGSLVTLIEDMKSDVKKIPGMEVKVEDLWRRRITESNSPSRLNEYGLKILKESKIIDILKPYYEEIYKMVSDRKPSNAYKVQEDLIDVLEGFQFKDEIVNELQQAAFLSGTEVPTILLAAAISMRDDMIKKFGFTIEEIDLHDPQKKKK